MRRRVPGFDGFLDSWLFPLSLFVGAVLFVGGLVFFSVQWEDDHPTRRAVILEDGTVIHCADSKWHGGFGPPSIIECETSDGTVRTFSLANVREVRS